MQDPTELEFLTILREAAGQHEVEYVPEMAEYLLATHFRDIRPIRGCYPRDIIKQLVNIALYERKKPVMVKADLDKAAKLYLGLKS